MNAVKSYNRKHIDGYMPCATPLRARLTPAGINGELITEDPGLP
jgi:hypothetical protein